MTKRLLIDAAHPEEVRVAVAEDRHLVEFDFESAHKRQLKGNIYLAKVTRIEPSLQAAFVEYGGNRQGFLPFAEIHYDYFQIPISDKQALAEAEQAAVRQAEAEEEDEYSNDGQEGSDDRDSDRDQGDREDRGSHDAENHDDEDHADRSDSDNADSDAEGDTQDARDSSDDRDGARDNHRKGRDGRGRRGGGRGGRDRDENDGRRARADIYRKYKIQEVLKRGQVILIQVLKEERGTKGAALTTYISLPGRYCVFMPNTASSGGVSRRIASSEDRKRLKKVLEQLEVPAKSSIIVRTAGSDRTKAELKRDYQYLSSLWDDIRELTLSSEAPAMIYEEGDLIKRSLRDVFGSEIDEVIVEGEAGYATAKNFVKTIAPTQLRKLKEYQGSQGLFARFGVDEELARLYEHEVPLPSGGYIVINPTEALVSIDVNSGRSTRERNIEETALKTNIEAADEIARQLRLRDLAGLVVIDFIDMLQLRNKKAVERELKDALKSDRARIQVGRISNFGLLEMSRQRMRTSIIESSTTVCPACKGSGKVRSPLSSAVEQLREIERVAASGRRHEITVHSSMDAAMYLLNQKRQDLLEIEERYGVRISIKGDFNILGSDFLIEGEDEVRHRHDRNRDSENRDRGGRDRGGRDRDRNRDRGGRDRDGRDSRDSRSGEESRSVRYESVSADFAPEEDSAFTSDGGDDTSAADAPRPARSEEGRDSEDREGRSRGRRGRRGGRRRNNRDRDGSDTGGDDRGDRGGRNRESFSRDSRPSDDAASRESFAAEPAPEAAPEIAVAEVVADAPAPAKRRGRPPRAKKEAVAESSPVEESSSPANENGTDSGNDDAKERERSVLRGIWNKIKT